MKPRRTTNRRLTSQRDQQKKHIIQGVVKRGAKPQLKAARKSVVRAVKTMFKIAALAALCAGAWLAYDRLFWRNPDYALSDVAFTSDGSLSREQALTTAHLDTGRNIYSYNLDAAREALKALPQVENVELRRYLPNRIEVTVTERKPVAWVTNSAQDERTHLLDARGLVFKPKRAMEEYNPLPVVTGVELEDLAPGKPIQKFELVAALELLRASRETGDTQILGIDVSKGYCLIATDQHHARLTFGLDDFADQLRRLSLYRREAQAAIPPLEIDTINLMVQYNVPVTFVQPPDSESIEEAPEPPRQPRILSPEPSSPSSAKTPKSSTPAKKEPTKKETPKRDGVLKKFRTA